MHYLFKKKLRRETTGQCHFTFELRYRIKYYRGLHRFYYRNARMCFSIGKCNDTAHEKAKKVNKPKLKNNQCGDSHIC